jgi:hypothetical protein
LEELRASLNHCRWGEYPAPIQLPTPGILALARVDLDLLERFLEFIGFANENNGGIYGETRNDDHATNKNFHGILSQETGFDDIILLKGSANAQTILH